MRNRLMLGIVLATVLAGFGYAQPFTYQGMLKQNGSPANGTLSMTFKLYDALTGGSQVGPTITQDVSVQNGLFTVSLDFGSVWNGSDRYLEIAVGSTVLSPRVKINPVPYASFAQRPWQTGGSNLFYTNGNVGIGTTIPFAPLSLGGGNANTKLALWQGSGANDLMGFGIGPNQFRLHLHHSGNRFSFLNAPNGTEMMTILGSGNVGIGTSSPSQRLHVVGNGAFTGNLGVGTTSPSQRLHVEGVSYFNGNVGIGTSSPAARLSLGEGNANTKLALWQGSGANDLMGFGVGTGQFIFHLVLGDNRFSFLDAPAGNELVTILGNGNVGIGTTSPTERLHVNGNIQLNNHSIFGLDGLVGYNDLRLFGDASGGPDVYIAGDGKIGIGTGAPSFPLHAETSTEMRTIFGFYTGDGFGATAIEAINKSDQGVAVFGYAGALLGRPYGVLGYILGPGNGVLGLEDRSTQSAGWGVWGYTQGNQSNSYGVYGRNPSNSSGFAILAEGTAAATGTKSFQIDHPLHPETHYLNHFCTEAPEPLNAYSGNVTTDAQGYATVQLPDYFEAINRDFRYQLTVIGQPAQAFIAEKIQNNRFVIRTDKPFVKVSWRVEAVRNDLCVQTYGYRTEFEKEDNLKGKYLHPELYGKPEEYGINYRRRPAPPKTNLPTQQSEVER